MWGTEVLLYSPSLINLLFIISAPIVIGIPIVSVVIIIILSLLLVFILFARRSSKKQSADFRKGM